MVRSSNSLRTCISRSKPRHTWSHTVYPSLLWSLCYFNAGSLSGLINTVHPLLARVPCVQPHYQGFLWTTANPTPTSLARFSVVQSYPQICWFQEALHVSVSAAPTAVLGRYRYMCGRNVLVLLYWHCYNNGFKIKSVSSTDRGVGCGL